MPSFFLWQVIKPGVLQAPVVLCAGRENIRANKFCVEVSLHNLGQSIKRKYIYKLLLILELGTRWGRVISVTPWPRFTHPRGKVPQ
jgi:hypothetical protein